ncbi:MAG: hypothetical protein U0414_39140 [Polyangiaceae bacterium]
MSDTARPHVIRRGDTPLRLSAMYGVELADIERHPDNAPVLLSLQQHCLPVGETVYIPRPGPRPGVLSNAKNVFVASVPVHRVSLVFQDGAGPLANERWILHGLEAEPMEGKLDAGGKFEKDVPIQIERLRLEFPARGVEHTIWVGHLEPPAEEPGWEARLREAGYAPIGDALSDGFTFVDKEARARALAGFQEAHGLAPSGCADPPTIFALCDHRGELGWW